MGLFAVPDSQISLTCIERFTTQTKADWLSPKRLAAWLSSVSYSGRTSPEVLHARLLGAPRGTNRPRRRHSRRDHARVRGGPARPEYSDRCP